MGIFGRVRERFAESFAIAREPMPILGNERFVGIMLRVLCFCTWMVFPILLAVIGALTWVAILIAQAFGVIGLVSVPFTLAMVVGASVLAALALTGVSLATNGVDYAWRRDPAQARPLVFGVAAAWLFVALIFVNWHTRALQDQHHWTVHLLAVAYIPAIAAMAAFIGSLFWRPLATPSSA